MSVLEDVLGLFAGLGWATVAFAAVAMACTFPAWLVGRILGARNMDARGSFLVESRPRRWILWTLASLTAVAAVIIVTERGGPSVLLVAVFLLACVAAQYAAFYIGFVRSAVQRARRDAMRDVDAVPPTPQAVMPAEADSATLPTFPTRAPAASVEDDLREAEDEGYLPARPQDI